MSAPEKGSRGLAGAATVVHSVLARGRALLTERELFLDTVLFRGGERVPLMTMGPRRSTLERWRKEGLGIRENWFERMCTELDIDYPRPAHPSPGLGVDFRMIPQFEEKILEHRRGHYVVQDWMGNITEISDEYDVTYIREAIDFVTRKWHSFPVTGEADFERMKRRYDLDTPGRFPPDYDERCCHARERDTVLLLSIPGPFWQMREWCGFEPLCILFAERPELIDEMCRFWSGFVAGMLERICDRIPVDVVRINEDMAYKGASMISPEMVRRHLLPVWRRWGRILGAAGVPVYQVDSDGKVDELLPLWIEAGFVMSLPNEVAAGCDVNRYQEIYGPSMAYSGGIDKRAIAAAGRVIEDEVARVAPAVRRGGYIPGCDHGMPPDISWDALLRFGRLWAEVTGWL